MLRLGFIDGSFPRPAVGSKKFEQWRRVDLMATSWLWNSISKDLVEAFTYASTSRELWLELQGRYGRSNRPMIYQIQRELSTVSQGDLSVITYFTKDQSSKRVLVKGLVLKRLCVETQPNNSDFFPPSLPFNPVSYQLQEPKSFAKVVRHTEWRETMNHELQALEMNWEESD
ncbi:hypothetical protein Sango_0797800 [Sesamum angolense]|uniref:Uncharacterized protein n=1 Tax=Sesamum angolense TaxID=2727404 RepID=A0AAE1X3U5_9LAMI|nr:hypothetical protein Sango_0797800 [Sesamum angolense]